MKLFSVKKGFTLVEMLIVISIVGLLATISIGEYTRFRKVSVLDLAADGIVASINDARDSAKFGRVGGEGAGSICYGVKFVAGADAGTGITKITSTFDNTKSWSKNDGRWERGGCEVDNVADGASLDLGNGIVVESINDSDVETCSLLFSPPNGDLDAYSEECSSEIKIGYGDENEDLQRFISVNLENGKAEVSKTASNEN